MGPEDSYNVHAWDPDTKYELTSLIERGRVLNRPKGNQGKKAKYLYHSVLSAFDIETTSITEIQQSIMYIWQWHFIDTLSNDYITVYGRTWEAWKDCRDAICTALANDVYMVVLVHNLSYEFQFLSALYPFQPEEVFATEPRSVLRCTMLKHLEFRCTMRHSNTSLSVYTKQWHVKHQKLSGEEFDYSIKRYPWTELSKQELLYAVHDVIGLCEAYMAEMAHWKDTLYTVPYTSTGYVRRICKKAWAKINYADRVSWVPSLEVYRLLQEAFRGGDTHGDRRHSTPASYGRAVICYDVKSYDRVSSYPDVLINCKYPLGDWYKLQSGKKYYSELDEIEKYINQYEKAIVTHAHFEGLTLRDMRWEMPYIPESKCLNLEKAVYDNGRIVSADRLTMTITDVDWQIIKNEYKWDKVYFSDTYYCRYKYIPDFFCDVVRQFYWDKTQLKGAEPGTMEEIEYGLKKNLLNALYGMAAMKIVRDNTVFTNDDNMPYINDLDWKIRQIEKTENRIVSEKERRQMKDDIDHAQIEKAKKQAFCPFQLGVWCTAWARLELHRAFWLVHSQGGCSIYADTDSCKFIGDIDFSELNKYYIERSKARGAYAKDRKGKVYYMGIYNHEYTAKRFAHMGAKKYIYEVEPIPNAKKWSDQHGFHLTIAGVNKEKGAKELYEMGGFDAWHEGTVFKEAGGVQGIYNDADYGLYEINGRQIYIGRNVCLMPDYYTLGESTDYLRVLEYLLIHGEITGQTLGVEG